ncbi:hypothetical protein MTY_0787 [Moorella thermoacetica Y72]|nr:hypothetical protein MTY_0787 [Moorella thermoacetica Y72]
MLLNRIYRKIKISQFLSKGVGIMGKVLIALNEEEQLMLQRICLDKDAGEALEFVLQKIAPKIPKKIPCLAGVLMQPER